MTIDLIQNLPLFSALTREEISWVVDKLPERSLPAGEILMNEGDPSGELYILLEGEVEVYKAYGSYDERLLGQEKPGSVIGELSLFHKNKHHIATVLARTPLRLLQISQAEFETLLKDHPELALELMRVTTKRLEKAENATIKDLREKNQQLSQAYQELKVAHEQLLEKERLEEELGLARYIQRSILPQSLPAHPSVEFGALIRPARAVGGDLYDFLSLDSSKLGIVVGDVSDKGVPAALFMALTYSLIKVESSRSESPENVLQRVNRHLLRMNPSCMFVTAFYGIWDYDSKELVFARAGHPLPIVLDSQDNRSDYEIGYGQVLGISENLTLDVGRIRIQPGSTVVFYSDGVSEATNIQGQVFGEEGLLHFLQDHHKLTAQELCVKAFDAVISFTGQEQQDDILLLAMKT